jgi:hypothetical protein
MSAGKRGTVKIHIAAPRMIREAAVRIKSDGKAETSAVKA